MTKAFVSVESLSKKFSVKGSELVVFEGVDVELNKGEFVCIIGHSGCGKSTILNVLAGLDEPSSGAVIMDGKEISGPSLDRGVVFQNYSLLPWLTAIQNVSFGVKARFPQKSADEVYEHSKQFLSMVGLSHSLDKKPSQLSGGMRQRVSIARAFATNPKLLLLDEPFGALDALTRGVIQDELIKIWSETQQTIFMITHDVDEAILLADRILLMTNGPKAKIAESVKISLPRPRNRADIINEPGYYKIRNHLVQFLVKRSGELAAEDCTETLHIDPILDDQAPPEKSAENSTEKKSTVEFSRKESENYTRIAREA